MSEAFHIISDGSCDLPMELTKEKDITVVPFYVSFEEGKYQKEMIEIGVREFYQEMVDHPDVYPKSSMPSVQDYVGAVRVRRRRRPRRTRCRWGWRRASRPR
jgi:fatty acid-binding protein DegV